jgi:hypothetical protein
VVTVRGDVSSRNRAIRRLQVRLSRIAAQSRAGGLRHRHAVGCRGSRHPDPSECVREPQGLHPSAAAAVFLAGPLSPAADRLASTVLDWRPGALVVVAAG